MLETLLERGGGDPLPLPASLEERYGGPLRVASRVVYANFVSTIDGVVSYDAPGSESAAVVSEGHSGDRFVLALLRAFANAVIVGAGTLRTERTSVWTPEHVFPEAGDAFAQLRRAMRLPPQPLTVIVTASGKIDLSLAAFHRGVPVLIATTEQGARGLRDLPAGVRVHASPGGALLVPGEIVALARSEGRGERILTEGGPSLLGRFLDARVIDELFLTTAPRLAGRSETLRRLALVEDAAFTPANAPRARIVSVKAADDYLFTRFALS